MQPNRLSTSTPIAVSPINDKWLRVIGVPLAVLPFVYFYVTEYGFDWRLVAMAFGWGVVSTAVAWELLRWWVFRVRSRYRHKAQTNRRILLTFGGYFIAIIGMQPLETWALSKLDMTGLIATPEFPRVYLTHIVMALSFVVIVGGYYEITYYLHLYRLAVTDAEALQKARLQNQYDSLKNQVNPHFLFNSLNSLSALITEDRHKAGEFLDELATVYRYLLQTNQSQLVTLRAELDFIRSYGYLLQTRYGPALDWRLRVDNDGRDYYLPPLTLQLLVENAIGHNILDAERPLSISIELTGNRLIVKNIIQRKTRQIKTLPGGLINLTTQFGLVGLRSPHITDDGLWFCVQVPLALKNMESEVTL